MITENREISKSFRTTPAISETLRKLATAEGSKERSESDIINEALTEYLYFFMNTNTSKDLNIDSWVMNEYYNKKISDSLDNLNSWITKITSASKVASYFQGKLPKDKEAIYVMFTDEKGYLLKVRLFAVGTKNEAHGDYSEIIKEALDRNHCNIVMVHNHPKALATPSAADIAATKKLYFACKYSKIFFTDSIILDSKKNFYSFQNAGVFKIFEKEFKKQDKSMFDTDIKLNERPKK